MTMPTAPMHRWSRDFVHEELSDGRRFRVFNAVDDSARRCRVMRVGTSLPSSCVAEALQQALEARSAPEILVCENRPEFMSLDFMEWPARRRIESWPIEYNAKDLAASSAIKPQTNTNKPGGLRPSDSSRKSQSSVVRLVDSGQNHDSSRSERGTKVAATIYSSIENAKINRVDSELYLKLAALEAIGARSLSLPHQLGWDSTKARAPSRCPVAPCTREFSRQQPAHGRGREVNGWCAGSHCRRHCASMHAIEGAG